MEVDRLATLQNWLALLGSVLVTHDAFSFLRVLRIDQNFLLNITHWEACFRARRRPGLVEAFYRFALPLKEQVVREALVGGEFVSPEFESSGAGYDGSCAICFLIVQLIAPF